VAVGSFGEVALLVPAMRKLHLRYRFIVDLKHPAVLQRYEEEYKEQSFAVLLPHCATND
jgi:hypothetical protein